MTQQDEPKINDLFVTKCQIYLKNIDTIPGYLLSACFIFIDQEKHKNCQFIQNLLDSGKKVDLNNHSLPEEIENTFKPLRIDDFK